MSEATDWQHMAVDPVRAARLDDALPLTRSERPGAVERLHRDVAPLRARSQTYRSTLPRTAGGVLPDTHAEVLHRAADARHAVIAGQVAELQACLDWAALHAAAEHDTDEHGHPVPGGERLVALAGDGAPLVAELAIPEIALRLGLSTDAGRMLLTDALELAHRLPGCWEALQTGDIPVSRARRVARATRELRADAAAFVDAEVAPYLHAVGVTALEEVVETATWRFDLPRAVAASQAALDRRELVIDLDTPVGTEGATSVCQVWGHLDRADAEELERAVADLAHHLLLAGSTETLDVRRSQALGMLARRETPVPVPDQSHAAEQRRAEHEEWDAPDEEQPAVVARRRDVVLHVLLSDAALRTSEGLATLDGCTHPVIVEQVRSWLTAAGTTTRVTVRPVIDLAARVETAGYVPSADLAEQVVTRDRTCVFPHCTRDARACDLDHVTAWQQGGTTSSDNIAPLCRRHHRLKTHHPGWTYRVLHPGTYLWTTPRGQRVLRDPGGTHVL